MHAKYTHTRMCTQIHTPTHPLFIKLWSIEWERSRRAHGSCNSFDKARGGGGRRQGGLGGGGGGGGGWWECVCGALCESGGWVGVCRMRGGGWVWPQRIEKKVLCYGCECVCVCVCVCV